MFDKIEAIEPEDEQEQTELSQGEDENPDEEQAEDDDQGDTESSSESEDSNEGQADPFAGQEAPKWVKEQRARWNQISRENRELKRRLEEQQQAAQPKAVTLRAKPKIDDHGYDSDLYTEDLDKWYAEKAEHDRVEQSRKAQVEQEQAEFAEASKAYAKGKGFLIKADKEGFEYAQESVLANFDDVKQNILMQGSKDSAQLVYMIGRDEALLSKLSRMKPVQFAVEIGRLESNMNTKRKPVSGVDRPLKASKGAVGDANSTLERLRAEADKTGDRTKVVQYMRQMRQSK